MARRKKKTDELTTFQVIQGIVAEIRPIDAADVTPESTPETLGMDSLDGIEMLMAIEEEFGLEIPDSLAEQLTTVQSVVNFIDAQTPGHRTDVAETVKDLAKTGRLLEAVYLANPGRGLHNLRGRVLKLFEEKAELRIARASLSVSCPGNPRGASIDDVREEGVDTAIQALCCAMTPGPGETADDAFEATVRTAARKLAKWMDQKDRGVDMTMAQVEEPPHEL